jgi:sec-independent protein translocase protein TatB
MFNVGGGEIIVIMLIALIVLGPQRLPDAARQIGKTMGELRRLSNGFQNEVRSALDTADDPTRVAARRNVMAKEEPVDGGTAADGSTEVDPAPKRPVRTEPLVAGPPLEARNGAAAKPATAKKAATKKPLTAKKATPKKAAAKKAATPQNGTAVTKATTDATTTDAEPHAEAAPSSPPTET